jgi:hypothetical protein
MAVSSEQSTAFRKFDLFLYSEENVGRMDLLEWATQQKGLEMLFLADQTKVSHFLSSWGWQQIQFKKHCVLFGVVDIEQSLGTQ